MHLADIVLDDAVLLDDDRLAGLEGGGLQPAGGEVGGEALGAASAALERAGHDPLHAAAVPFGDPLRPSGVGPRRRQQQEGEDGDGQRQGGGGGEA